jgi:hypothetical protein
MHYGSTNYLELIDKHDCNILFEKGWPSGRLKKDFISLVGQDGRVCQVELHRGIFDDFVAASFIKQDGPEDAEGRMMRRCRSSPVPVYCISHCAILAAVSQYATLPLEKIRTPMC